MYSLYNFSKQNLFSVLREKNHEIHPHLGLLGLVRLDYVRLSAVKLGQVMPCDSGLVGWVGIGEVRVGKDWLE